MKRLFPILLVLVTGILSVSAVPGSFDFTAPPAGWEIVTGTAAVSNGITPADKALLTLQTPPLDTFPVDMVIRVKPAMKQWCRLNVVSDAAGSPLLSVGLLPDSRTGLRISAQASGKAMATDTISSRYYGSRETPSGEVNYAWRFPAVKNLWDDRDRHEIGSDYAALVGFDEKRVVVRMVLTASMRQVWVDDRLVAESRIATEGPVRLALVLPPGSVVQTVDITKAEVGEDLEPLRLDDYRSDGSPRLVGERFEVPVKGRRIPVRLPGQGNAGIDLGNSLFRYRLSEGAGPDAGYVNGQAAYPNPFRVDPAVAAFRVPYRDYRHVWLLAWLDDDTNGVPRGSVRFYRDGSGYDARRDFEITAASIADGRVVPLDRKTADGRLLYLVRVPVDTDALYGFSDMRDQFLDMEISKPLYLLRSYPDPIYYGYQPGGLPSSVHVIGITLEAGTFGYTVEPTQYGHVFEDPEIPTEIVTVHNTSGHRIKARVELRTRSYDGTEQTQAVETLAVPARESAQAEIALSKLKRLGWHELVVRVTAGDEVRENTLSLVRLPRNSRSYGNDPAETRFGAWMLLGHYTPFSGNRPRNERVLAMLRKLGIRRVPNHAGFFDTAMLKRHDFLPNGSHTIVGYYHRLDVNDPKQMQEFLDAELKGIRSDSTNFPVTTYFYGGEWNYDHHYSYTPDPRYTGGEPYVLGEAALKNLNRQLAMFKAVGERCRKESPGTKLILQWGAPMNTIGFLANGFPNALIDGYGMDAPMFELTPEVPWLTGCINQLWQVRQEIARLGRPQLPISWCEGPFFPTNEGALSEREQAENQVRYWLMGLAYGVENFEAGMVASDAGNYYGAEHYGAGVFRRVPLECPKPAVAALATASAMLCGMKMDGPVDTGVLTTYALAFKHPRSGAAVFALWRVTGTVEATITVDGKGPVTVTDSMGNPVQVPLANGTIRVPVSPSPVWVTGVDGLKGFTFPEPQYAERPAETVHALPAFSANDWQYDGSRVGSFESNHIAIARGTDPQLTATFDGNEAGHPAAASITLAEQPVGDRPLLIRYGAVVLKQPAPIPGRASALGVWMKGNSGWGRIAYQVRDAKGERWTSIGARDDWNCDDTFTWSYAKFEGWRYVRFPLPANRPYDNARYLDSTWWGHEGGDGIVDLPLTLEKIFVTARNEVQYLGQMKRVPGRTYQLAGLVAEYEPAEDRSDAAVAQHVLRKPVPKWEGPEANPITRMLVGNTGEAPVIKEFAEPLHFNDGRRMVVRFDEREGCTYELYLSRYRDGRGADKLPGKYKDNQEVRGFRPGVAMYLFLVATDAAGNVSKPSAPWELITADKFREK